MSVPVTYSTPVWACLKEACMWRLLGLGDYVFECGFGDYIDYLGYDMGTRGESNVPVLGIFLNACSCDDAGQAPLKSVHGVHCTAVSVNPHRVTREGWQHSVTGQCDPLMPSGQGVTSPG